MPNDLKEQYDESKRELLDDKKDSIEEKLYRDIMFCCEKIQADFTLKVALENVINDRNVKLYIIDADKIALDAGIKGKISKIMQMVIMSLMDYPNALEVIGKSIEKQFATKGDEVINANKKAITLAMDNLILVDNKLTVVDENVKIDKNTNTATLTVVLVPKKVYDIDTCNELIDRPVTITITSEYSYEVPEEDEGEPVGGEATEELTNSEPVETILFSMYINIPYFLIFARQGSFWPQNLFLLLPFIIFLLLWCQMSLKVH